MTKLTENDVENFVAYPEFAIYQMLARLTSIYPGKGTPLGLMYTALKGCGEAGEFAENVGKAIRDDGFGDDMFILTDKRKELLIKELGDELWYIAAKCDELGISMYKVAELNLRKLLDRQERDKIKGSGDNR